MRRQLVPAAGWSVDGRLLHGGGQTRPSNS